MRTQRVVALLAASLFALPVHPSLIGTSKPAEPLTEARIEGLPIAQRKAWMDYLHRSQAQMAADHAMLNKERKGMEAVPPLPTQGSAGRAMPLNKEPEFYKSAEARRIGDVILTFQTPGGGWSKNLAFDAPRAKGQNYAAANASPTQSKPDDFDHPTDEHWHYISTLDNDATNTELHFLALLAAAFPEHDGDAYRASFLRGVQYLLNAQYPNGGWPQVWPLEGGYHDAITFNDDAVVEATELLRLVSEGKKTTFAESGTAQALQDFRFVPASLRKQAAVAVAKALDCILKSQIHLPKPDGAGTVLTVWPQQVDPLTLEPVSARNYEPASLSSGESASLMHYLMSLQHPSRAVVNSVRAAATWFEAHKIEGYTWSGGRNTPGGRTLTATPGAPPLWARYYSLTTQKPIFGDRDKTIHDDVMDISLERRNGYAWFGNAPSRALAEYATWAPEHKAHASR